MNFWSLAVLICTSLPLFKHYFCASHFCVYLCFNFFSARLIEYYLLTYYLVIYHLFRIAF